MRPLADCLAIADELKHPLGLDYLELAVGVRCDVQGIYNHWPLVLHDSCLEGPSGRLRLDPLKPSTWAPYLEFCATHEVLGIGVHAPARRRCTAVEFERALTSMEQEFRVPIAVEVMPLRNRWCSDLDSMVETRVLLDVSHILIWERGCHTATERTCRQILDRFDVAEIHLSHNGGQHDSHDLIPAGAWFEPLIEEWSRSHFVTYESLPARWSDFERLDLQRNRWTQAKLAELGA